MDPIKDIQDLFPWVPNAHDIRVEVKEGRAGGNGPVVHDRARIVEGTDKDPQKLKLKKTDGEITNVKNSDIERQRYFSWEFLKWRWQDYMMVFEAGDGKYMPLRFADLMDLDDDLESLENFKEALEDVDLEELDEETLEELDLDVEKFQEKLDELSNRQVLMAEADYQRRWDDATESQIENTMDAWNKNTKLEKYLAPAVLVIVIVGQIIMLRQFSSAIASQNEKLTTLVQNAGSSSMLLIGGPSAYWKFQDLKNSVSESLSGLREKVF
jgi:hypothetical protein